MLIRSLHEYCSPLRIHIIALDFPTACVRRCVPPHPGIVPNTTSGCPNFALSDATMMSHLALFSSSFVAHAAAFVARRGLWYGTIRRDRRRRSRGGTIVQLVSASDETLIPNIKNQSRDPLSYHAGVNSGLVSTTLRERSFDDLDSIAHHRELASAPERVAVDSGDDWLADRFHVVPEPKHVAFLHRREALAVHLLDIRTRRERL